MLKAGEASYTTLQRASVMFNFVVISIIFLWLVRGFVLAVVMAAIFAASKIMLDRLGLKFPDVKKLFLAGGFEQFQACVVHINQLTFFSHRIASSG